MDYGEKTSYHPINNILGVKTFFGVNFKYIVLIGLLVIGRPGGLEGVADGEVEGHGFPEVGEVVVAFFAGVVGGVEADAEVAAEDEHADVEAEA